MGMKKCRRSAVAKDGQREFGFVNHGGKRRGAGRKPKGQRALVYAVLLRTLAAGSERFGLRLTQFSIQSHHAHLIVEVDDRRALSRGMQGLCIRIARGDGAAAPIAAAKTWLARMGWRRLGLLTLVP